MSRALDLLAGLRLLPSPLLSTFVWKLAREVAVDADRSAVAAHRARGERDEARADRDAARAAEAACYEREAATARRVAEHEKALRAELEVANRSCVELQCEVDRARAERDALAVEAQGLRAALATSERLLGEVQRERDYEYGLRVRFMNLASREAKDRIFAAAGERPRVSHAEASR